MVTLCIQPEGPINRIFITGMQFFPVVSVNNRQLLLKKKMIVFRNYFISETSIGKVKNTEKQNLIPPPTATVTLDCLFHSIRG